MEFIITLGFILVLFLLNIMRENQERIIHSNEKNLQLIKDTLDVIKDKMNNG